MKKANSGSATKRNVARKNRHEYLAAVGTLTRIRAVIRSAGPPEATEVISYRIPSGTLCRDQWPANFARFF